MKRREDMPAQVEQMEQEEQIKQVEERIRDAFRAAAQTVTARDLPGLPVPQDRSWLARRLQE
jgi:hypothetical protein